MFGGAHFNWPAEHGGLTLASVCPCCQGACDAFGRIPGKVDCVVVVSQWWREEERRRKRERREGKGDKGRGEKLVLMRKVISLFIFPAERNDQTEQEERREIKQRLTRKVRFLYMSPCFDLTFCTWLVMNILLRWSVVIRHGNLCPVGHVKD